MFRSGFLAKKAAPFCGKRGGFLRYTTTQPPTKEAQHKSVAELRGWRKHLHAFRDRPASHITAFAVLHELTAVAPLVGVYYALDYVRPKIPVPQTVLEEGNRYINKMRSYVGCEPLDADSPVLVHLATSYAVVKAAAPLRVAASLALTPWFARWCVIPVAKVFGKLGSALRK
ncbi:hypothetical protein IW140_004258 [Coemansia sp. RSA 1813]|nr:hypothetical protein LPJ74_003146 [Coemansia sp. RSA 1843]KAJ2088169.1 hypothetical protein IW138_004431 [Coemansia sp. RSA 986]KAJ2212177.1 hypothetical protein EV179_004866 [Coemansia sp. RSA 487]KAJ2568013.1 hypothetical protein IW140_004258 [Coemansia sp. RSA 1813]